MCTVCNDFEARVRTGTVDLSHGAIAQVVERLHGMEKAEGSSPSSSTLRGLVVTLRRTGFVLAGLVAGEGSFTVSSLPSAYADGSTRLRFRFCMTMTRRDRSVLEALQQFLGVGSIQDRPRQRTSEQPTSTFVVGSHRQLHERVIPFAETFLIATAKRQQFEEWRDAFEAHETAHPSRWGKGPSTCSVEGCHRPVRGRGVCRSHYHQLTGY